MKKITSLFLAVALIILIIPVTGAVSINDGATALRAQWSRGKGPTASGYAVDYSYYQPTAKKGVKYPLFIFMAGATEGTYQGKELTANSFCNWSSEEYQAKVKDAGGAYLLILRAPEPIYFDTLPTASIMAAIKHFVGLHTNIDTSRIYATGWCIGAVGVKRIAVDNPDYFAGIVMVSPCCSISEGEAKTLADTAVWLIGCTTDGYSFYSAYTGPAWKNIQAKTNNKAKIRLTKSTSAPNANLMYHHQMWQLLEYDFSTTTQKSYSGLSTVNGYGNTINNVSAITWLSSIYKGETTEEKTTVTEDLSSESQQGIVTVYITLIKIYTIMAKYLKATYG